MPAEGLPAGSSSAPPARPRRPSRRLPGQGLADTYLLERCLHAGRLVEVWLARADGVPVALKLLAADAEQLPAARDWLRAEYRLLAGLHHAHVLETRAFIDQRDAFGFASEYLGGGDLVSLAGGDPRIWLPAARGVADGLDYLHAQGFVHRDVKARNCRFDAHERVRLIDFGSAARIGSAASDAGTTRAHRPRTRARVNLPTQDWHAFAVLLYELINGRLPDPARTSAGTSAPDFLRPLEELVNEVIFDESSAPAEGARFSDTIESVSSEVLDEQ